MALETTPDQIRNTQFRSTVWGLERAQVEEVLRAAATRIEELEASLARAAEAAAVADNPDMRSEFDTVGQEVTAILQTAREAAEAMRERASMDAARWRSESIAEAEERRRESSTDAEALRRDAWATGTQLIEQAQTYAVRISEQADRDVLTVMGEAEREAHRLTSSARRDAEDLVRNASMTAEKMTAEATRRRDEILDAAARQASVSQERTHALEKRRDELLEELEHARSTLNLLEASLEVKRDSVDSGSTVRVVPAPPSEKGGNLWVSGETVRVVKPEPRRHPGEEAAPAAVVEVSAPPETVRVIPAEQMRQESSLPSTPEPVPPPAPEPEVLPEPEPATSPESASPDPDVAVVSEPAVSVESGPEGDSEVDSLFASLRGGGRSKAGGVDTAPEAPAAVSPTADDTEPVPQTETTSDAETGEVGSDLGGGRDWIEERDARLLPITNRALRGIKKSITELQNIALDQLRTDPDWRPEPSADADLLAADLITLWAESFASGHSVAEVMSDTRLKRPPTPHSETLNQFSASLSSAVTESLDAAGSGQRERQSAASRVYRVWRSDEAEQRVRELAIRAYQLGVELSSSGE